MAVAAAGDPSTEVANLMFVSFNQDGKSLVVGHHSGYNIYSLVSVLDAPTLQFECDSVPDTILVERMFSSSLIVVVSRSNPRLMTVYHFVNRSVICEHRFGSSILNVKMNRERLIVCLEDCIHVFNLRDMRVMHTICDTPLNRTGMIDLSGCGSPSLLAYPGSITSGNVHIFDAMSLSSVNTFQAHANTLAAIRFNTDATKLATASTKGTVIRVFSVPNGTRLFEFRRGVRPCNVNCLAFSSDSIFLCSSSNTETIHVYKLQKAEEPQQSEAQAAGWLDYFSQRATSYLPVNDLLLEKDFALARLPVTMKNVSAMLTLNGQPHLVVASTDGYLYCYRIPTEGGICELVKQHRIGTKGERGSPSGGEGGAGIPTRPPRSTDQTPSRNSGTGTPPDMNDPDEFPPMSHASG